MSDALLACLERLAGPYVSVAVATVGTEDGLLDPEPQAVAKAIPKRRAEFAAGRRAARAALAKAGLPAIAIPQGPNRAPLWPDGTVGSISHDAGLAVASIAEVSRVTRLGIDLAEAKDFPEHLRSEILRTPAEQAQSGLEARLSFSAKESVFKAFYPEVGRHFGFDAVEITPDMDKGVFTARLCTSLGPVAVGTVLRGQATIADDRLVTILVMAD